MRKPFELINSLPAPADDDALVDALLAFANGRDVVIYGQPTPAEVRSWSIWRVGPSDEERASHVRFLHGLMADPWGGLGHMVDPLGRRRPTNAVIELPTLEHAAERADRALLPDRDSGWLAHMHDTINRRLVLVGRRQGYSPADFRSFQHVSTAIAFAMLLVMDQTKPYVKALSRCKWSECQRFYLAHKNPKGGPPNRTYCNDKHRDAHHNSAERKSQMTKARHK
jgi:hypothetical protein